MRNRYAQHHPDWNVIEAPAPPGPWIKALAVMPAVAASPAGIVVVADADVWCPTIADAVSAVQRGRTWAIPHFNVCRLDSQTTQRVLRDPDDTDANLGFDEPPYRGYEGGGVTVLQRDAALAVPMDPRFKGWGGEDAAWGYALAHFYGRPWRGTTALLHLWHPPQHRLTRKYGSIPSKHLFRRYAGARNRRDRMMQLIQEVQTCLSQPSSTSHA